MGCCSLRVEHINLSEEKDGKEYVVEFDFLGKDSIRYYNCVPVEKRVFKNLQLFKENKQEGDDLFDRLNVSSQMPIWGNCICDKFAPLLDPLVCLKGNFGLGREDCQQAVTDEFLCIVAGCVWGTDICHWATLT